MKAQLMPPLYPPLCEPLASSVRIGGLPVGNRPLATLTAQRLSAMALNVQTPDGHEFCTYVPENAWLSDVMLKEIARTVSPFVVRDNRGRALAWVGTTPEPPEKGMEQETDEDSFLVQYPWDLLRVNEIVVGELNENQVQGEISPAAHVDGVLHLGAGSHLLPGVFVEGNAVIGENCKIGPNCYIRGNTSIGSNCHIGNAVEIKNSILMDNVSIGHLSYCGDSILGQGSNFGAGTVVANLRHDGANHQSMVEDELVDTGRRKFGVIVGNGAHTGINTSFYPGRKMWPNTATRPGQIVDRDITS